MNGIKLLRLKLGLGQQQMAAWLCVSRSLVALYEREERSLPPAAVAKLAQLEIIVYNLELSKQLQLRETFKHAGSNKRHKHTKQMFLQHARVCAAKVLIMRSELTGLENTHTQTIACLVVLETLLKELPDEAENKIQFLWLRSQQQQTLEKLKRCDEAAQLLIKAKMAMLEATKEVLEKLSFEE